MADKTIRVKGVVGCAGVWGALYPDDVRELPADIAESLVRCGHAVRVDAGGNELAAEVKKSGAAPKSKRAAAS